MAASYYSIIAKGPAEFLYLLSAVATLGGLTILWSLGDGEAGNLMFDGGSICKPISPVASAKPDQDHKVLFGTTIMMYLYSVIPSPSFVHSSRKLNADPHAPMCTSSV